MKDTFRYAITLFLVGAICSSLVVISSVYANPILEKRENLESINALNSLYQNEEFTYNDISNKYRLDSYNLLDKLYIVETNNDVNYVYKISTPGKNGNIVYLISINNEGEILEISFIVEKETPGRGDKITLPDFKNQVIGSTLNNIDISVISGATISSSAIITSVETALQHFEREVQ